MASIGIKDNVIVMFYCLQLGALSFDRICVTTSVKDTPKRFAQNLATIILWITFILKLKQHGTNHCWHFQTTFYRISKFNHVMSMKFNFKEKMLIVLLLSIIFNEVLIPLTVIYTLSNLGNQTMKTGWL